MTSFSIRPATLDDIDILHTMVCELAQFLNHEHVFLAKPEDLAKHLFEEPLAECIIAELSPAGPPIGYSIFYRTFSTFRGRPGIHVEDIFVRDGFREHKVGRALVHRIAQIARDSDACRIQWEAPVYNERARNFYDSLDVPTITGWVTYRLTNAIEDMATSHPTYINHCDPPAKASRKKK